VFAVIFAWTLVLAVSGEVHAQQSPNRSSLPLPLAIEPNEGQAPAAYKFLARQSGGASANAPPPSTPLTTPAGTYTVNFTVTNSQISRSVPLTLIVK
jgi:hypothetical protein